MFTAYQEKSTPAELIEVNLLMLKNMVEGMKKHSPSAIEIYISTDRGANWSYYDTPAIRRDNKRGGYGNQNSPSLATARW